MPRGWVMEIIALNRRWVVYWQWLFIILVVIFLLLGLAMWQWQRANYKAALLQRFAGLQQIGVVSAAQLHLTAPAHADGLQFSAEAYWLSPYVWLLDNQMLHGKIGYDVLVPMRLQDTGDVLLVNLGWLAAPLNREQLPAVNIPQEIFVQGLVRNQFGGLLLGRNSEINGRWPMRIQQIDLAELSKQIKQPLYNAIIYQQYKSPYLTHYQAVVITPERHRAYALQWALLALAVVVIAVAASAKKQSALNMEVNDVGK